VNDETAARKSIEDAANTRSEEGFTAGEKIAIAQVYATLAIVAELKEVYDVLKGIEDSLDAITNQVFLSRTGDKTP